MRVGPLLLLLLHAGCTGPWVKFEPTKYEYAQLAPVTVLAMHLDPEDESEVETCRVERIGYLRCSPDCTANSNLSVYQFYGSLPEYAASFGATHILQIDARFAPTGSETSLTSYASPYGMNTGTAKTRETGPAIETYRLYRVKTQRQYLCLDTRLRPVGLTLP